MKRYEYVEKPRRELEAIVCDRCKREFPVDDVMERQEFLHWADTTGYASIWGDEAYLEIDLCQYCVKEVLGPWMVVNGEPAETEDEQKPAF